MPSQGPGRVTTTLLSVRGPRVHQMGSDVDCCTGVRRIIPRARLHLCCCRYYQGDKVRLEGIIAGDKDGANGSSIKSMSNFGNPRPNSSARRISPHKPTSCRSASHPVQQTPFPPLIPTVANRCEASLRLFFVARPTAVRYPYPTPTPSPRLFAAAADLFSQRLRRSRNSTS